MAATPRIRQPFSQDVTKYAVDAFEITPDDGNDLTEVTRAISFATAGTLRITTQDGTTINYLTGGLAAGAMHPLGVARVHATGTTVTGIVGYV